MAALRVVLVSYPTAMVLLGALAAIVGGPIRAGHCYGAH
ncbi:putative membrane protein [Mycobacterium xenopi 3993]|nr:putative membrane protein [Mycobacterium xenopi 3993]